MINGNRTKSGRERHPRDYYITPVELAISAMNKFFHDEDIEEKIIYGVDAGCGTGIWGLAGVTVPNKVIDGVDIDITNMQFGYAYHWLVETDFLNYTNKDYDIVLGNPPYSMAEDFIRHSFDLIKDNGYVYFLLRLSFLEGIKRSKGLFKEFPLKKVYVCSRRPSFYQTNGKNTTDTLSYAMFLWQKGYKNEPTIDWLDWKYEK